MARSKTTRDGQKFLNTAARWYKEWQKTPTEANRKTAILAYKEAIGAGLIQAKEDFANMRLKELIRREDGQIRRIS